MLNRMTSCILKTACVGAFVLAMSSQADAFWYWYSYPVYRPVYTAYRPVYYSAYRPVYYQPACTTCTACRVGCAPCGCNPCGCNPCQCSDGCSVTSTSTSLAPVPDTKLSERPTRIPEVSAPEPLDLDEQIGIVRVSPTRQRLHSVARYRVPQVARLEVMPEAADQSLQDPEIHVASR